MTDETEVDPHLEIKVGSVWRDTDPRYPKRRVEIVAVHEFEVEHVAVGRNGLRMQNIRLLEMTSRFELGDCYVPDDTGLPPPFDPPTPEPQEIPDDDEAASA